MAATEQSPAECQAIPAKVMGKPAHQAELGAAGDPVAPHRRDLRDPVAAEQRLHGDLERDLEAVTALDRERVEHGLPVHLERAGRVRGREADEHLQRASREAREPRLEARAAELLATRHVARPGDEVVSLAQAREHARDVVRVVGGVRHGDDDGVPRDARERRAEREGGTAAEAVLHRPDLRASAVQVLEHRQRRVVGLVVDDDDLVRHVDAADELLDHRARRLPFPVDGNHDAQLRHRAPTRGSPARLQRSAVRLRE